MMQFKISTVHSGFALPKNYNGLYAQNNEIEIEIEIGETVEVAFMKNERWLINLYKRVK